eukprot:6972073-Alexandrium_andersonii.AAC.1
MCIRDRGTQAGTAAALTSEQLGDDPEVTPEEGPAAGPEVPNHRGRAAADGERGPLDADARAGPELE